MRKLVCVVVLGLLTACASYKNEVASLQVLLVQAEKIALAYAKLPLCPTEPLCADTHVLRTVQLADRVAYSAVWRAREIVYDPAMSELDITAAIAAAQQAIGMYRDIVLALEVAK